MKKSNMISTKDELIRSFSKEQMEIYNYYKSKFCYSDQALVPMEKEDRELAILEKGCKILKIILKAEIVLGLAIATFVIMFNGFPKNTKSPVSYKQAAISTEIKYNPNV